MSRAAFIYSEEMAQHDSRLEDVFGPTRLQYIYELLKSYHAFDSPDSILVAPGYADEASLLSFHTEEYVAAVRSLSDGERTVDQSRFNFSEFGDNPVYPGMYESSILAVGGSLKAAELVFKGEVDVAFNCAGGLHHAAADHASGFCIFNDAVIAINYLLAKGLRVAYVDIDAHHADGVQRAFYTTDRVLTVSLHESGRYLFPGTGDVSEIGAGSGEGYSVNVPLAPHTSDEVYLRAFAGVVPYIVERFKPDIIVTQLGCDSHYLDPLTGLSLTSEGYTGLIRRIQRMAPKWVALGGGGYEISVAIRLWTLAYGIMLGVDLPDGIPHDYRERYGISVLKDTVGPVLDDRMIELARGFASDSVAKVRRIIFPYYKL